MKKQSIKTTYVCDLCERSEDISNGDRLPFAWISLVIPPKFKRNQIDSRPLLTKHICPACVMGVLEGFSSMGRV